MAHLEQIPGTSIIIDRRPYKQVGPRLPWTRSDQIEIKTEAEVEANHKSHQTPEAGYYPGGSQIEGWSPLTRRTAWKVPDNKHWAPLWYSNVRDGMATFFEFASRLRLPYRITLSILVLGLALVVAPFVPVLSWYNAPILAAMTLFGGKIPIMDFLVSWVMNPLLSLVALPLAGFVWLLSTISFDSAKQQNKQLAGSIYKAVFHGNEPKGKVTPEK